tara:strand:- start:131 stop:514 length:384 start_codon:yes stop_codon:yes gene_type:complete
MSGMHLLPVYYSTTNTRKRKQKKKSASVLEAERQHAKFLKKMGVSGLKETKPKRSLAQSGSAPALGAGGRKFESYNSDQVFYDPSMAKKKENVYTGTEIIGIGQMHKSNAVPIRRKDDAKSIANMRR